MNKYLVIIPAYNEAGSIMRTVKDVSDAAPGFDIIVINDCSTDPTLDLLEKNGISHIDLSNNLGIGGAMQAGFLWAERHGYDVAVQIDGDGQHDPSYLEMMTEEVEKGSDLVIGSRYIEHQGFQSTGMRRAGSRYLSWVMKMVTGVRVTDPTSGMRACGKRLISFFAADYPGDYPEPESTAAAIRSGFKVKEIPVVMRERSQGRSSISGMLPAYYMIKVSMGILFAGK